MKIAFGRFTTFDEPPSGLTSRTAGTHGPTTENRITGLTHFLLPLTCRHEIDPERPTALLTMPSACRASLASHGASPVPRSGGPSHSPARVRCCQPRLRARVPLGLGFGGRFGAFQGGSGSFKEGVLRAEKRASLQGKRATKRYSEMT